MLCRLVSIENWKLKIENRLAFGEVTDKTMEEPFFADTVI